MLVKNESTELLSEFAPTDPLLLRIKDLEVKLERVERVSANDRADQWTMISALTRTIEAQERRLRECRNKKSKASSW